MKKVKELYTTSNKTLMEESGKDTNKKMSQVYGLEFTLKIFILPKVICRFNVMCVIIPVEFSREIEMLKFI